MLTIRKGRKPQKTNSSQSSPCVSFVSRFFGGSVLLYLHLKILLGLLRLLLRSSSCELPNAEILRAAKGRLAAFAAIFAFQTERAHMLPGHHKPRVIFFCLDVFELVRCFGEFLVFLLMLWRVVDFPIYA